MKKMKLNALFLALLVVSVYEVTAAAIEFNLDEFTGNNTNATITVDDNMAGFISVSVQVNPDPVSNEIGDITGIFFDASTSIQESDINVTTGGPSIGFGINTNNLNGGVNLSGGGQNNPGIFDIGLRFDGFNVDDVQLVEFTIDNSTLGLGLDDFDQFALRLQTVGVAGGGRGGSSKLVSGAPTPVNTPDAGSTLALMGIALAGLGALKRRK